MRWIDIFRISVRMLRTNGLRSVLTVLGIGVAISLIVVLIGIGYGLQNITIGSIVESKTLLSLDIQPPPNDVIPLTSDTIEIVRSIPGIRDASPVVTTAGEIRIDNKLGSVTVVAAEPSYLDMEGIELKSGDTFRDSGAEVIVTPQVLELLDLGEAGIVGSPAKLTYTDPENESESKTIDKVTIIGIANSETATIYIPYKLLADGSDIKFSLIKAVATDRAALVTARDLLVQKGLLVETLIETLDQARTVFRWVTTGLTVFGTIALVVAAIGMFNTLTISLMERTREIGIMKAIGVTNGSVKKLFLAESAILGLFGGLSGVIIGLLLDQALELIINQIAIRYGGSVLQLFQYPRFFLLSMVLYPIILAVLTGLYPAMRASRLNPLRALRYE